MHRTSQATADLIFQLGRAISWGPCRIEGYLRNYNEQSRVGHATIHKILNQAGLNNPIPKPRRVGADPSRMRTLENRYLLRGVRYAS